MRLVSLALFALLLASGLSAVVYPPTLVLPIYYYDYAEWSSPGTAPGYGSFSGLFTHDAATKTEIRKNSGLRSTPAGQAAAAACDFDICAIGNHKSDCVGWTHVNYENKLVADNLAADGLPQLAKEGQSTKGLSYWYRNHTYNAGIVSNITLDKIGTTSTTPIYKFNAENKFYPLRKIVGTFYCKKSTDANCNHPNHVYATHFKAFINYNAQTTEAREITIRSDDDSFLFIDGKIVNDWGGTRSPTTQKFSLPKDKYVHGQKYQVDFFHADRCPTESAFTVQGTFTCETFIGSSVDSDGDGVPDCSDFCPDDPYKFTEIRTDSLTCLCGDNTCLKCPLISPLKCAEATAKFNLQCEQCAPNGPCVESKSCECSEIVNEDKCNAYQESGSTARKCQWCKSAGRSTSSCVPIKECECGAYNDLTSCSIAASPFYECRWCNGVCLDNKDTTLRNKHCTCAVSTLTRNNCFDILDRDFKNPSCTWCTYDQGGGGYCDTVCKCSRFSSAADESKCLELYRSTDKNTIYDPKGTKLCDKCEPDDTSFFCIDKGAKCSKCTQQTTPGTCRENKYTNENNIEVACTWCGGKCFADPICPECDAYKDRTQCENATDSAGKSMECGYCKENECDKAENCPTCNEIFNQYKEDLTELEIKCTETISRHCNFCGNLAIDYDARETSARLCVDNVAECPMCSEIPSIEKQEYTTYEQNCEALRFIYSVANPAPKDANLQRCGYCPYTETCVDLGTEIQKYAGLATQEEKDTFVFTTFCDTNCHNYDSTKEGCSKSNKNCTWCELPNGASTCNSDKEECAHCAEYDSDYLCVVSGSCTWCKQTSECISSNSSCSNPSAVAAGIGAGVVAAIVIAAIVALVLASFASKKMYDAIMDARAASMDTATSNPLFEDDASGGVNPAFAAQ